MRVGWDNARTYTHTRKGSEKCARGEGHTMQPGQGRETRLHRGSKLEK